jgi:hypothetical protein
VQLIPAYLLDLGHRVDGVVRGHRRRPRGGVRRVLEVEGHGEVGRGRGRGGGVGELRGGVGVRDGLRRHCRDRGWADGVKGPEARARGAARAAANGGVGWDSPVRLRLLACVAVGRRWKTDGAGLLAVEACGTLWKRLVQRGRGGWAA